MTLQVDPGQFGEALRQAIDLAIEIWDVTRETWPGGPMPDDMRAEFRMAGRLAQDSLMLADRLALNLLRQGRLNEAEKLDQVVQRCRRELMMHNMPCSFAIPGSAIAH